MQGYQYWSGAIEGNNLRILNTSLLYQSRFIGQTTLLTDNDKISLTGITVVNENDVISKETRSIIRLLDELERRKVFKSNHYPVERLCIKRWLVLSDYLSAKGCLNEEQICISDWDNFILSALDVDMLKNYKKISLHNTNIGLSNEIHPAFSIFTNEVLYCYKSALVESLANYCKLNGKEHDQLFNDKLPWATVHSRLLLEPNSLAGSIDILLKSPYRACRNIRHLREPGVEFETSSWFVPKSNNYTGNSQFYTAEIRKVSDMPLLFGGQSKHGEQFLWANLDFQGVEGKYVLVRHFLDLLERGLGCGY